MFFFSQNGLESFWIRSLYWTFPIVLMITFSRFEYFDAATQCITNSKLEEIEALINEQGLPAHSGGLYIDGKMNSEIGRGIRAKLKLLHHLVFMNLLIKWTKKLLFCLIEL